MFWSEESVHIHRYSDHVHLRLCHVYEYQSPRRNITVIFKNVKPEEVLLLTVGLDVFCKLHSQTSIELRSTIQNSYFYHASENGLTVPPENSKPR
jgi:hypothetical protein